MDHNGIWRGKKYNHLCDNFMFAAFNILDGCKIENRMVV